MDMFRYREDNTGRRLRNFEYKSEAKGVEFKLSFQVNEIGFNSRLNEDFIQMAEKSTDYSDLVNVIKRDYTTNKR